MCGLKIPSLLFAEDMVLFATSNSDLKLALRWFATKCEVVEMRMNTSKSEAMFLSWKRVYCTFQVREELLPQVEGLNISVLFRNEGEN